MIRIKTRGMAAALLMLAALAACESPTSYVPREPDPPASVNLPTSPAGRRLAQFLAVVNSGDTVQIRRFITDSVSPDLLGRGGPPDMGFNLHVDISKRLYRENRGLVPAVLERAEHHAATVIAYGSLVESFHRIGVVVEAQPPHRIIDFVIEDHVGVPAGMGDRAGTAAQVSAELRRYIDKLAAADAFSGTVRVERNGRAILEHAVGWQDAERTRPNTMDTRFNMGSIGKPFTAVAVGQLVQEGRIALDDTVGRFLPAYPNQTVRRKVTVRHLLGHTSGLRSSFNPPNPTVAEDVAVFAGQEPMFTPGARFSYSNDGFTLLGRIVEVVAGADYRAWVRDRVITPSGMTSSGFLLPGDAGVADGLTYFVMGRPRDYRVSNRGMIGRGGPAGGMYATARDLARFGGAVFRYELMNRSITDEFATTRLPDGMGSGYGYGFMEDRVGTARIAGHAGNVPGGHARLLVYRDHGYTVVILSNYDAPSAAHVAAKARALILGA